MEGEKLKEKYFPQQGGEFLNPSGGGEGGEATWLVSKRD
jgi:hypothetical protein